MEQRLSIVTLGVRELSRARAFYLQGLGWKESSASNESITFIQAGGIVFALYPHDALAEDVGIAPQKTGFSGVTLAYNTRSRDEVDTVLAHIEKIGGKIVKPAEDVFWGGYSGYFTDLDDHLWEVAWNPFFPFDDKGNLALPD